MRINQNLLDYIYQNYVEEVKEAEKNILMEE